MTHCGHNDGWLSLDDPRFDDGLFEVSVGALTLFDSYLAEGVRVDVHVNGFDLTHEGSETTEFGEASWNGTWSRFSFSYGACLLYTSPSPRDRG